MGLGWCQQQDGSAPGSAGASLGGAQRPAPTSPPLLLHGARADEARWLRGCRVIKSRFGTSKCGLCGETIDPGCKIAKEQGAAGRGGWAHAACLVQQRKGGSGGSGDQEEEEGSKGGEGGEEEEEAPPPRKRKGRAAAAAGGRKTAGASSKAKRRRASEE